MAEFLTSGRSLYDMAKNLDASGNSIKTAEVLTKNCNILKDAPVKKANNILTHKETFRTALPTAEVKRLNEGVGGAFPSRDSREFGLKNYQSLPWVDKLEMKYAKNPDEVRQDNMEGTLIGWAQSINSDFIYDSVAANGADSINGIATYCNTIASGRVVSAGGTGGTVAARSSIYIVGWDMANGAYALVPEKDGAGVTFERLDDSVITDPNDVTKRIAVENYKVEASLGLGTRDPRAFQRVANIDESAAFNPEFIMTALSRLPVALRNKQSTVIYMTPGVELALQKAANSKSNASFVYGSTELFAQKVATFNGYPIRIDETISTSESVVS